MADSPRSSQSLVGIPDSRSGTGGQGHLEVPTRVRSHQSLSCNPWLTFRWSRVVSETVIEFNGLTVVQVSQNQAAVVSDPQNQVFVIKNGGFVALALQGSYDVLSVVDQTHLSKRIIDHVRLFYIIS